MGQTIGRYVLDRVLGRGGLGTVYLGTDPKLHRKVAIKRLEVDVDDQEIRRRFLNEVRAITKLSHSNIVQLYDYSDEDSRELYLVMEYIPGRPLHQLIQKYGPMSEETALCIGHQLASALEHAHAQNVVHRDVKPENVILHDGRAVLLDFGSMKIVKAATQLGGGRADDVTQVVGTPGFMAPEQFEGRGIEPRTDIFALGAVLYNVTTDALPYHGSDLDDPDETYSVTKRGRYRDPRDYQPLLSAGFCELLEDCLAPRTERRIATAAELQERILERLGAHGITDVEAELRRYEEHPDFHEAVQLDATVDNLLRDLKLALLRDLQSSVRDKLKDRARIALRQLEHLASLESEVRPKDATGAGAKLLARPRGWLLLGILLGALAAPAAFFASWYFLTRDTEPDAVVQPALSPPVPAAVTETPASGAAADPRPPRAPAAPSGTPPGVRSPALADPDIAPP